jgi:hypothetical protein
VRASALPGLVALALVALPIAACGSERAAPAPASPTGRDALVGCWESVAPVSSGFAGSLRLAADGSCALQMLVLLNGTYEQSGSKVTVKVDDAGKDATGSFDVVVEGTGLRRTMEDRSELLKPHRASPRSAPDSIVGTWSYTRHAGTTAHERFASDGRWGMRMPTPNPPKTGTWTTTVPGELEFTLADKGSVRLRLETVDGESRLVGASPGSTYRRVGATAWYPLD